jgi:hypothetical protein
MQLTPTKSVPFVAVRVIGVPVGGGNPQQAFRRVQNCGCSTNEFSLAKGSEPRRSNAAGIQHGFRSVFTFTRKHVI